MTDLSKLNNDIYNAFCDKEISEQEKGHFVADVLDLFVNLYDPKSEEGKAFTEALTTMHRTLQQSLFSFIMELVSIWAQNFATHNYDLRNEYTCAKSAEIVKLFDGATRAPLI